MPTLLSLPTLPTHHFASAPRFASSLAIAFLLAFGSALALGGCADLEGSARVSSIRVYTLDSDGKIVRESRGAQSAQNGKRGKAGKRGGSNGRGNSNGNGNGNGDDSGNDADRLNADGSEGAGSGVCARMSWPVDGPVSSPFGKREGKMHDGIDVAVVEDTPVRAACDGIVAYAGNGLRGYGNLVIVRHDGALATVYAHNRELVVHEGEPVTRGQILARSGQTGRATAPHLHFEVRKDSIARNPLGYLRAPMTDPNQKLTAARRAPVRR